MSERSPSLLVALLRHRLAWPLITLALLLIVNTVFNSSFLHIEWRDGHLYGSLIDILNRAAPLVLVSLGMTLVIATRGIDISVGATVAIAAAVAAWLIGGSVSGSGRISLERQGVSSFRLDLHGFRLIDNEQGVASATQPTWA